MAYFLSPVCNSQIFDANGNPLVGGKVYTYLAGTTTPAATYTDNTGATPQANPITLNSLGLPASPIWLLGGIPLKFVIKDSSAVTLETIDNVSGVNDTTISNNEWQDSTIVPTYISATSFSVPGDQTLIFQVLRRLKTKNTSGLIYSTIVSSVYGASITTVTLSNDAGTLDSGLTIVSYAVLSATNSSVPTIYAKPGANNDITALNALTTPLTSAQGGAQIQPIGATVASNALTISASAMSLDFRSGTPSSGSVLRANATPTNLVVPAGATLGTVSGNQSRLIVLALSITTTAIDLAVVNVSGGTDLSETGVISTTAISAAATSASVVYSTTARTNVAYRVIGYIESTQATAGTWATAPSTVQGAGGQSMASISSFGSGQSWQNVSGSRAMSTTYYNTTGKLIALKVAVTINVAAQELWITVNGNQQRGTATGGAGYSTEMSTLVPSGGSYIASVSGGTPSIYSWNELR